MWEDSRGFLAFDWTLSLTHLGCYLNIDDILSTNDRLLCKTRISLHRFSPLFFCSIQSPIRSQSRTEDAIYESDPPSGTRLEVPLWLISSIGSSRRQMLLIELPIFYTRRVKNLMEASLNANKPSVLGLISRLEELEQALFRIGRSGRCSIDRWFSRLHERLEASTVAKVTEATTEASEPPLKASRKASALAEWHRSLSL
ncbi:unnamed protein product [Taenia asiatica]|uniref:DNA replication complex GINS protein PSF3 n=1 Tax=Taenia asiatica TaxID=60517 RepID=A0A0R3VX65_TAEAS|nr:unnamed protein product [Taenia asiatica]